MLAVLTVAAVCVTGAMADGTPQIQVGKVDSVIPGGTVEVPVILANNPGINTFTLTVEYDHTRLSLANAEQGAGLGGTFLYTESTETVSWQSGSDTVFAGTAFTLLFNVLDDAPLGDASVSISYTKGNICNYDEEDVDFAVVPSSVTVEAAPHEHSWGSGEITTPATCESAGEKTFTCSICKTTRTEDIIAPGHEFTGSVTASTPATCTEAGTETRKCVRYDTCGKTDTKSVGQPAGHDYTVTTTPATCTEDGEEVSVCKNCAPGTEGHEITKVLKAAGHKYDDGEVVKEATCTEEGEMLYTCTACKEGDEGHTKAEVIPMTAHTWNKTATENGYEDNCSVCGSTLVVKVMADDVLSDAVINSKRIAKYTAYDVVLMKGGVAIQPDGSIRVRLEVPADYNGANCVVYRMEADGNLTKIASSYTNGWMIFEAEHFSTYIVAESEATGGSDANDAHKTSPKTGDESSIAMWLMLTAVCAAPLCVTVTKKRAQR